MSGDAEQLQGLVQSAQRGNREDFSRLIQHFGKSLLYFFAIRGVDPELAQDNVQETFIRVYESLGRYDGRSQFSSWLYGIARNVYLESKRRRQRHSHDPLDQNDAASQDTAEANALSTERRAIVRGALGELPDRMQLVLQLRFVEGKSCAEIATILGTSVAAVSPLIYRAKQALRKHLSSKLETPGP
jgi:RNA polymerase sigma-70 factor (ECF subfamily)